MFCVLFVLVSRDKRPKRDEPETKECGCDCSRRTMTMEQVKRFESILVDALRELHEKGLDFIFNEIGVEDREFK